MASVLASAEQFGIEKHPRKNSKHIGYGTAGFRTDAAQLDHVLFRMGLLAVLRSKAKGATIGVMITASHNPEEDNGVKLIDPRGEMLDQKWEKLATDLANVCDDRVKETMEQIVDSQKIDLSKPASVYVGRDSRPSSLPLYIALKDGVSALGGEVSDWGLVTTPMLHYFVAVKNDGGVPQKQKYFSKLADNFKLLRNMCSSDTNYKSHLMFDGANGVGAVALKELISFLGNTLTVEQFNYGKGKLNFECGADYVKVGQCSPKEFPVKPLVRCVSVDGDADRVVYFYTDSKNKFHLLDGDKIATLVAGYLIELIRESDLDLQLGVVQTAYANGSSTEYISQNLRVPVACVPTGVKHLHHKALEFDIGVYFEANGHGTVVFNDKAVKLIQEAAALESSNTSAKKLLLIMGIINQTVGDALSDMLLVESVLAARGWSIQDWDAVYTDLPNKQTKMSVKDRQAFLTTDAERRCVSPEGLQDKIDQFVAAVPKGRAFVRPSGTEDVIRIYSEADTPENVELLAQQIAKAVSQFASS